MRRPRSRQPSRRASRRRRLVSLSRRTRVGKELQRFGSASSLEEVGRRQRGGLQGGAGHDCGGAAMVGYKLTSVHYVLSTAEHQQLQGDGEVVAAEEGLGVARQRRAIECYELQKSLGGYFLREHPKESTSWKDRASGSCCRTPRCIWCSPMCKFGMKMANDKRERLNVRKRHYGARTRTRLRMSYEEHARTSSRARRSIGMCISSVAGRAKAAQVYPKALCIGTISSPYPGFLRQQGRRHLALINRQNKGKERKGKEMSGDNRTRKEAGN